MVTDSKTNVRSVALRGPKNLALFDATAGVRPNAAASVVPFPSIANSRNKHAVGLLSSWKDISAYLNRGVRTVQRWEQMLELPVHRISAGDRAPVFAFEHEIDLWLQAKTGISPAASGRSIPDRHAHLNSRRQRLIHFVQQLRQSFGELERQVAAEGFVPNANITDFLASIQKLVNAALAQNQAAPVEGIAQGDLLGGPSAVKLVDPITDQRFKTALILKPQ